MSKRPRNRSEDIKSEILQVVASRPGSNPSAYLQAQFGFSRQALNYFCKKLVAEEKIETEGYGRGTRYFPKAGHHDFLEQSFTLIELKMLEEERVFDETVMPFIYDQISESFEKKIRYCTLALLANAIDHSAAKHVFLRLSFAQDSFTLEVADDGVGAFQLVSETQGLSDVYEAAGSFIRKSAGGKRKGNGIYHVAHLADALNLEANGVSFSYRQPQNEWTVQEGKRPRGTYVNLTFDLKSDKSVESLTAH